MMSDIIITLFLTEGNSLSTWQKYGMLKREMKIYENILHSVKTVQIFSYGTSGDKLIGKNYKNVKLLCWFFERGKRFYKNIGIYIHYRKLKKTHLFKTNQILGSLTAVKAKKYYNKPLIVRCGFLWSVFAKHRNEPNSVVREAENTESIAFKEADKIVVTCSRDKKTVIEKYLIPENKISIIPNYVDTQLFKPILNINKEAGSIVFVGRLVKQKNLFNLLKSVEKVKDVTELKIIGEGYLYDDLYSFSKEMKTKVTFLGNVPNETISCCPAKIYCRFFTSPIFASVPFLQYS